MEIFKLFGSVLVNTADAEKSISSTGEKAEGLGGKLSKGIGIAAKWGAAIAAGAVAAGSALMALAGSTASAGDEVDKMSQKIGISRQAYQELAFACSQCGTDVNVLKTGLKTLTSQMQDASNGSKTACTAFDTLGVSIYDSNGNLKNQETMLFESLSALQGMEDQTLKAALATDLFGKAGVELMPMLNGEAGSIDDLREKAQELGLVMSDEAVDASVKYTDAMDQLKRSFSAIKNTVGAALLPVFTKLVDWILANMPVIQETIGGLISFIQEVVAGFQVFWDEHGAAITAAISAVWENIKSIIQIALNIITDLFNVFSALFSGDWGELWESVKKLISDVWDGIKQLVSMALDGVIGILKGIWTRIKDAAEEVFNKAKEGFSEVWDDITTWFSETVGTIVDTVTGIGTDIYNAGAGIFNDLLDGIKSVWTNISGWVSEKVDWLADKLAFWRRGKAEMDDGSGPDGAHASGLPFVPYDGYRAELHRGETVVNAADTAGLINDLKTLLTGRQENQPITIVVQSVLDGKVIGETVTKYQRQKARATG